MLSIVDNDRNKYVGMRNITENHKPNENETAINYNFNLLVITRENNLGRKVFCILLLHHWFHAFFQSSFWSGSNSPAVNAIIQQKYKWDSETKNNALCVFLFTRYVKMTRTFRLLYATCISPRELLFNNSCLTNSSNDYTCHVRWLSPQLIANLKHSAFVYGHKTGLTWLTLTGIFLWWRPISRVESE